MRTNLSCETLNSIAEYEDSTRGPMHVPVHGSHEILSTHCSLALEMFPYV